MHVFQISLVAGHSHPTYTLGTAVPAVCMVDSRDTASAREMAYARLGELGWAEARFATTVLMAEDPDISAFTEVMREAFADAQRLGVSIIEYPDQADAD